MLKAILMRGPSTDQGTFGVFMTDGFECSMTELPWRNNASQISCIPVGEYKVVWEKSPKFGMVYRVLGVPNRNNILIHAGNYAGDVVLGFRTHSHGCLLPSIRRGKLDGQKAGLVSATAVWKMQEFFKKQTFLLEVKDA